jgi:FlaA1/EpsC-like NDP-sugar epimerase
MSDLKNFLEGKVVCVTGGVGSVGSAIIDQLLQHQVAEARSIDINESGIFSQQQHYQSDLRYFGYQGNIESEWDLSRVFKGADYVIHAAALKHVPSCEQNPFSAIDTNILGLKSLIRTAINYEVKKVLFTSSDKAVSPTNVMGGTKLLGERLIIAANQLSKHSGKPTIFTNTRFGNVIGSNGSVIPLFLKQIEKSKPITVTDKEMTRFFMGLNEAANLVLKSLELSCGGETFITKMPVINIHDLALVLKQELDPLNKSPIKIIGTRPGEKIYEELNSMEETRRSYENNEFLCVLDIETQLSEQKIQHLIDQGFFPASIAYNSSLLPRLTHQEIRRFLEKHGALNKSSATKLSRQKES